MIRGKLKSIYEKLNRVKSFIYNLKYNLILSCIYISILQKELIVNFFIKKTFIFNFLD